MSVQEHTLEAFRSNVEDLALDELAALDSKREELEAALNVVNADIKALRNVMRAIRPAAPKPKKAKKQQVPFAMSDERLGELHEWLRGNTDEITSRAAKERFPGWSDSYVASALKELREDGTLRVSATSGGMNIYRSMI